MTWTSARRLGTHLRGLRQPVDGAARGPAGSRLHGRGVHLVAAVRLPLRGPGGPLVPGLRAVPDHGRAAARSGALTGRLLGETPWPWAGARSVRGLHDTPPYPHRGRVAL